MTEDWGVQTSRSPQKRRQEEPSRQRSVHPQQLFQRRVGMVLVSGNELVEERWRGVRVEVLVEEMAIQHQRLVTAEPWF